MESSKNPKLEIVKKNKFPRFNPPINWNEALDYLMEIAKNQIDDFVIDENNEEAYMQMLYYFYGDSKKFHGDLHKGLFLIGKIGSGKTEAFEIFKQWILQTGFNLTPHKIDFNIGHARRVVRQFENEEKNQGGTMALKKYLSKKSWVFNDLGREIEDGFVAAHYGKKLNVFKYIFDERYILFRDFGAITHATSNFPLIGKSGKHYFEEFYGEYIDDRMKTMFNTIIFKGNSRRK